MLKVEKISDAGTRVLSLIKESIFNKISISVASGMVSTSIIVMKITYCQIKTSDAKICPYLRLPSNVISRHASYI